MGINNEEDPITEPRVLNDVKLTHVSIDKDLGPGHGKIVSVTPDYIALQRRLRWPDIYPEDFCHICGNKNPSWYAIREEWTFATQGWAGRTGREGICCPTCFAQMFNESAAPSKWIMKVTMEKLSD